MGHRAALLKLSNLFRLKTTPSTFIDEEIFLVPDASLTGINECFCFHPLKQLELYLYFIECICMFPKPTAWFLQNSRSFDQITAVFFFFSTVRKMV